MSTLGDHPLPVAVSQAQIEDFCRRWQVEEFSLFGSVLRDDFRPDSDIDVLVRFLPSAARPVFDLVNMKDELERLVGRRIDLVVESALRNPFRRASILGTRRRIYAA